MLQSYAYRVELDEIKPDVAAEAIRALAARLIRIEPRLRGLKVHHEGKYLHVTIRVAGNTRWDISHNARSLILKLTRAAQIKSTNVKLQQVVTEINGRQLYLGEGRTEMRRQPRAQRQEQGDPWGDYEWWGDDLSGGGANTSGS